MHNLKDLTEQRFESWRVLSRDDTRPGPTAYWNCRCKCGNMASVQGKNLRSGKSVRCKKCADKRRGSQPSLRPGDKIGRWTILRRDKVAGGYLCRCKCGAEGVRQIGNLRGGKTTGCKACWVAEMSKKPRKKKQPLTDRTLWTAKQLTLLGTKPDHVIAAKLGRSGNAVRLKRSRRGIPQFKPTRSDKQRTPC